MEFSFYRYHLYYLWKSQAYSNDPVLILKKAEVADRIKYLMKRLTKDTVKSIGRHIAKLAFSNPLIAFDHVITQLQKYDNLNVPMADVLKMFSQLSVDVMIYTLVEELSDPSKQKINQATASLSPWLNSKFCYDHSYSITFMAVDLNEQMFLFQFKTYLSVIYFPVHYPKSRCNSFKNGDRFPNRQLVL